ncbi:MAG: menaquinone biosynthetic enzyme MqnA/MqnD family protein [Terriglobia bacterium]
MSKLRLSVVQYLNTVPLIWGMQHGKEQGKFDLNFTTPAECADAIRDGAAGAGIIPSIELQRIENLQVITGVSISSLERVKSVVLLSKKPIEQITSVALDTSSRTSAVLVEILLKKFYKLKPRIAPANPDPEKMLEKADAGLLIGDPALALGGTRALVYDLAAEWKKFTGLPFVFALWAGPQSARLKEVSLDFQESRDYGLARVDDIAEEYAPRCGMTPGEVKIYLTRNINYNLDDKQREGLDLFYHLAREQGLIPGVRELNFV